MIVFTKTGSVQIQKKLIQRRLIYAQVNPTIFFAGPEGTGYTDYLIDPQNHEGGDPDLVPDILSVRRHNLFALQVSDQTIVSVFT